ncbi:L,D-transpeptidase family protein [Desulfoscipio gibsoniae]
MIKKLSVLLTALCFCFIHTGLAIAGIRIVINKSTNQLHYFKDEVLQKTFPVATGKNSSLTPEGSFSIIIKLVDPYYARKGIPGGSPQNPLGCRWLGLSVGGGGTYGIHGTNNPSSIGTYASGGCIRMYNQDVSWLYDHTPVGTPVKIIRSSSTLFPAQPEPRPKPMPVTVVLGTKTINIKEPVGTGTDGSPLLPLRTIFEALDYTIGWNDADRTIFITNGIDNIAVSCASKLVSTSQNVFTCSELKLVRGIAHAPLSFWEKALPLMRVSWKAEQRKVTFTPQIVLEQPIRIPETASPAIPEAAEEVSAADTAAMPGTPHKDRF